MQNLNCFASRIWSKRSAGTRALARSVEQSQPLVDTAVGKSLAETRFCQQKSASVGLRYHLEALQLCQRSLLDYGMPPLEDSAHTAKPTAALWQACFSASQSVFQLLFIGMR